MLAASDLPLTHERKAEILLVASGKGGVGKTWFSISLAESLSLQGSRVLLFDGDLGLANVDVQLGLMPELDLGNFMAGKVTLPDVILSYPEGKFDVLAGRSGSGTLSSLTPQRLIMLREGLRSLGANYDFIIVDLGAGIGGTVRALSEVASQCIIVVTDEPTSLTDAYAFIKVTAKALPALPVRVVVNMAETKEQGEKTYGTLQRVCDKFLGINPQLLGVLVRDPSVRDAIRHQRSYLSKHPSTPIAQDIRKISRKIQEKRMVGTTGFEPVTPTMST